VLAAACHALNVIGEGSSPSGFTGPLFFDILCERRGTRDVEVACLLAEEDVRVQVSPGALQPRPTPEAYKQTLFQREGQTKICPLVFKGFRDSCGCFLKAAVV
jgi:hypothetical protein